MAYSVLVPGTETDLDHRRYYTEYCRNSYLQFPLNPVVVMSFAGVFVTENADGDPIKNIAHKNAANILFFLVKTIYRVPFVNTFVKR